MPIVDLSTEFTTRYGQPMVDGGEPVTLRHVLFLALDATLPEDARIGPAGKLRLARTGLKIASADEKADLASETVAFLLERAANVVNALVYGQMVQALDPGQLA